MVGLSSLYIQPGIFHFIVKADVFTGFGVEKQIFLNKWEMRNSPRLLYW